jgi:TRAP-type uncharacterized transport system substrate-binding protein
MKDYKRCEYEKDDQSTLEKITGRTLSTIMLVHKNDIWIVRRIEETWQVIKDLDHIRILVMNIIVCALSIKSLSN